MVQHIDLICLCVCLLQDSDALSRMQQAILQLQAELDRLSVSTQQLIDDNNMKQTDIDVSDCSLSTLGYKFMCQESGNVYLSPKHNRYKIKVDIVTKEQKKQRCQLNKEGHETPTKSY